MNEWLDAESFVELAHEAFDAGRLEDAETALREALAINPARPEWHFNLGLTLEAAGRFLDASRAFGDCHDLDPEDPATMLAAGVNLLRAEQPKASIAWFEKAHAIDPTASAPFVHRIEAHARLGDHDQAELMFYLAQQVNPKDAGAFANLAESLLARGQSERAAWCLREAAQLEPQMPKIHGRLADAYAASGRLERARQLYIRELRTDPGDLETLLDLGCLLIDMNRLSEAGEKFRRVLEVEPDNIHAHFYIAEIADREHRASDALAGYRAVLGLDAEFSVARRRLLSALLRQQASAAPARASRTPLISPESGCSPDLPEFDRLIESELAHFAGDPTRLQPDDLEELGRLLLDARRPDDARAVLARLADLRPLEPEPWHLLSLAYYQLGDRLRGQRVGRRVLKLDPSCVPAIHNLAVAAGLDRQWTRAAFWIRRGLAADPADVVLRRLRVKLVLARCLECFRTKQSRPD